MNTKYKTVKKNNLEALKKVRAGNSILLNKKIENLKSSVRPYLASQKGGLKNTIISSSACSATEGLGQQATTGIFSNLIAKNKLENLNSKTNANSNLYENALNFSDLLTGGESPSNFNGELQNSLYKYAANPKEERSGIFMSLNSIKHYFNYLSKALANINTAKGKGKLSNNLIEVNSYKIRHYLNLLTKFDYKLSNSYYDYFQFKKSNKNLFTMEKAAEMLKTVFLSNGCLISKPIFNVVHIHQPAFDSATLDMEQKNESNLTDSNKTNSEPQVKAKIIIHLFYYVKTSVLYNIAYSSSEFKSTSADNRAGAALALNIKGAVLPNVSAGNKDRFITTIYNKKFAYLSDYLTKLFNTEVELELVRLYKPYQDSNILAQHLNSQSYRNRFTRLTSNLFRRMKIYNTNNLQPSGVSSLNMGNSSISKESASYPSGISGLNIRLAGRAFNERIIPRLTVKEVQRGNFKKLNSKLIEKSMFTDKTRKGAFNFTVTLNHVFR